MSSVFSLWGITIMPVLREPFDCKYNTNPKSENGLFCKGISRLRKGACVNRPRCQCRTAVAPALLCTLHRKLISSNSDVYNPEACIWSGGLDCIQKQQRASFEIYLSHLQFKPDQIKCVLLSVAYEQFRWIPHSWSALNRLN